MGLFILSKRETGYNGWSLQSEGSNILKGFQFTDSYLSTRYCGGLLVSEDHLRAQSCGSQGWAVLNWVPWCLIGWPVVHDILGNVRSWKEGFWYRQPGKVGGWVPECDEQAWMEYLRGFCSTPSILWKKYFQQSFERRRRIYQTLGITENIHLNPWDVCQT